MQKHLTIAYRIILYHRWLGEAIGLEPQPFAFTVVMLIKVDG